MTNIGTPDYQRGVVSAQALLASVPANTGHVTVGIPPNAESLIVMIKGYHATDQLYCEGVTTGLQYPGSEVLTTGQTDPTQTFIFDVTDVVDNQVTLVCADTPTVPWWVYSDAGVHVTVDMSKLSNYLGQQYVIPSVPGVQVGDHPPNEILFAQAGVSASASLIPAPGAGLRNRLFSMFMTASVAGVLGTLYDIVSGLNHLVVQGPGNVSITLPGQGFPMPNNSELELGVVGSGTVYGGVYYTVETI